MESLLEEQSGQVLYLGLFGDGQLEVGTPQHIPGDTEGLV